MNGKHEVSRVQLDPALLSDDKEMLEDLVAAAINDATRKIEKVTQRENAKCNGRYAIAAGHESCHFNLIPFRFPAYTMLYPPSLLRLIEALRVLPGGGAEVFATHGVSFVGT